MRAPARLGRVAAVLLIATAAVAVHPVGVAAQDGADTGGDWGAVSLPQQRFFPLRTAEDRWLVSTPLRLSGEAEVRIAARRVAGERVEFALQQRRPDGDWGAVSLPQQRFFPLRTAEDRWLVSTPLRLSGEAEVRIAARRVAGERVEFALQQRRPDATPVVAAPAPTPSEIAAAETQTADLVNDLRRSLGLDALAYNSDLAAVAGRWSRTLAVAGAFAHNPNYAQRYPQGWQRAAENIARVTVSTSLSNAVQRSFDSLVDSPGHYSTMTDAAYTHIGVGIAVRAGSLWVTQNFARYPAGAP